MGDLEDQRQSRGEMIVVDTNARNARYGTINVMKGRGGSGVLVRRLIRRARQSSSRATRPSVSKAALVCDTGRFPIRVDEVFGGSRSSRRSRLSILQIASCRERVRGACAFAIFSLVCQDVLERTAVDSWHENQFVWEKGKKEDSQEATALT